MKEVRRLPRMIARGAVAAVLLAGCGSEGAPQVDGTWSPPAASAAPTTLRPEPALSLSPTPTPNESLIVPTQAATLSERDRKIKVMETIRDYYNNDVYAGRYLIFNEDMEIKKETGQEIQTCVVYDFASIYQPGKSQGTDSRSFTLINNDNTFKVVDMDTRDCELDTGNATDFPPDVKKLTTDETEVLKDQLAQKRNAAPSKISSLSVTDSVNGYVGGCFRNDNRGWAFAAENTEGIMTINKLKPDSYCKV